MSKIERVTREVVLPSDCLCCKLYVPIEGEQGDYAGIVPKCCALLEVMPSIYGIALDRPNYCPLNSGEINLSND